MSWLQGRTRSEKGAIAIMVALLATVLFGCAALAVDMGNAWSRKRAVQKQVDVSALAAGWMKSAPASLKTIPTPPHAWWPPSPKASSSSGMLPAAVGPVA